MGILGWLLDLIKVEIIGWDGVNYTIKDTVKGYDAKVENSLLEKYKPKIGKTIEISKDDYKAWFKEAKMAIKFEEYSDENMAQEIGKYNANIKQIESELKDLGRFDGIIASVEAILREIKKSIDSVLSIKTVEAIEVITKKFNNSEVTVDSIEQSLKGVGKSIKSSKANDAVDPDYTLGISWNIMPFVVFVATTILCVVASNFLVPRMLLLYNSGVTIRLPENWSTAVPDEKHEFLMRFEPESPLLNENHLFSNENGLYFFLAINRRLAVSEARALRREIRNNQSNVIKNRGVKWLPTETQLEDHQSLIARQSRRSYTIITNAVDDPIFAALNIKAFGFLRGTLDGVLLPFQAVGRIFSENLLPVKRVNNGVSYVLGFIVGVILLICTIIFYFVKRKEEIELIAEMNKSRREKIAKGKKEAYKRIVWRKNKCFEDITNRKEECKKEIAKNQRRINEHNAELARRQKEKEEEEAALEAERQWAAMSNSERATLITGKMGDK